MYIFIVDFVKVLEHRKYTRIANDSTSPRNLDRNAFVILIY